MNNTENDRTKYILGLIALVLVIGTGFSLAELRKDQQNKQNQKDSQSIVKEVNQPASQNNNDTQQEVKKDDTSNTNLDKKAPEPSTNNTTPAIIDPNAINPVQVLNAASNKDGVEIKVVDLNSNFVSGNVTFVPAAGNKFIALGTSITNNKGIDFSYNNAYFSLKDLSGATYRLSSLVYSVDGALTSGKLTPKAAQNGTLIFEVPQNSQDYTLLYDAGFDGKNEMEIKLFS